MSSTATPSATLQDCLERQREILTGFIATVDGLIAVVVGHESSASIREEADAVPEPSVPVLALLLQATGSSAHTLSRLSDLPGLHTRDCYSIARSVVEVAVNTCYIIAEGPAAAERATRHARQKSYRDLERESKIGDSVIKLVFSGQTDPSSIDGLEEDLAEFTSRGDGEKGWVDGSIDDRIAATATLGTGVVNALHWARFAIYRHSSEILHGTFFSALFFFGQTAPSGHPRSAEEFAESLGQQHMLILMSVILSLSAVVEAFHKAYGFRAAHDRATTLMDALGKISYFCRNGSEPK
jgi:hypothetical protein